MKISPKQRSTFRAKCVLNKCKFFNPTPDMYITFKEEVTPHVLAVHRHSNKSKYVALAVFTIRFTQS